MTPIPQAPEKKPLGRRMYDQGQMGLKGLWAQIANMTAVALMCVLFYQTIQSNLESGKEDRKLFRESVEKLRDDSERQWQALREDSARQWESIRRLTSAVKSLVEKENKDPVKEPER